MPQTGNIRGTSQLDQVLQQGDLVSDSAQGGLRVILSKMPAFSMLRSTFVRVAKVEDR